MIEFFSACTRLFTRTFNAACGLEFFQLLAMVLLVDTTLGLFLLLQRGGRKL